MNTDELGNCWRINPTNTELCGAYVWFLIMSLTAIWTVVFLILVFVVNSCSVAVSRQVEGRSRLSPWQRLPCDHCKFLSTKSPIITCLALKSISTARCWPYLFLSLLPQILVVLVPVFFGLWHLRQLLALIGGKGKTCSSRSCQMPRALLLICRLIW